MSRDSKWRESIMDFWVELEAFIRPPPRVNKPHSRLGDYFPPIGCQNIAGRIYVTACVRSAGSGP